MKKNIDKKILIIVGVVIVVLLLLLSTLRHFRNFEDASLVTNKKDIFSVSDLKAGKLKFGSTEDEVLSVLGKPKKETQSKKDIYKYKTLSYNGIEVTLKENYDDYILTAVEITSSKYKVGRNIKVNSSIYKAVKKYKVENKKGTYIYGNYTVDKLDSSDVSENIYMAVRGSKEVVYINKDAKVEGVRTNIARLTLTYKKGKIKKISWSYDFE